MSDLDETLAEVLTYLHAVNTEIASAKDQTERVTGKAIRFDLDELGISEREKEAEELVSLRAENALLKKQLEETHEYFLGIDDGARTSGLTYNAVRDIMNKYLTDEEEVQISFGKMVEEMRSLCRVCAEEMVKAKDE